MNSWTVREIDGCEVRQDNDDTERPVRGTFDVTSGEDGWTCGAHGAEKLHHGGFIGMSVSRSSVIPRNDYVRDFCIVRQQSLVYFPATASFLKPYGLLQRPRLMVYYARKFLF